MTFAPEEVPISAQQRLRAAGVRGSIGHTCASATQTRAAIDAGTHRCTHVCNAMPPIHHRSPGPVLALLLDERVRCEVILDGHHLDDDMVQMALRLKGAEGLMAVSDAMPLAELGVSSGVFHDVAVASDGSRATTIDGRLAVSVTLLPEALRRTQASLGLKPHELAALGASTAADDLGLSRQGRICPGHVADLVIYGDQGVEAVLRAGAPVNPTDPRLPGGLARVQ